MNKTYTCGICGQKFDEVLEYGTHVSKCVERLKKKEEAEKEQKRMEELNAALNRVKEAKKYFEDQLDQFKEKYPEEYELNFVTKKKFNIDKDVKSEKVKKENYNPESIKILYSKKNDEKPDIHAKVNGKDVELDELFTDPDVKSLCKLLGIIE